MDEGEVDVAVEVSAGVSVVEVVSEEQPAPNKRSEAARTAMVPVRVIITVGPQRQMRDQID